MIRSFGVFNIEKVENTTEYQRLYEALESEKKIEDISCNKKNSFILTEDKKNVKGYISNIGTNTMRKRKIV